MCFKRCTIIGMPFLTDIKFLIELFGLAGQSLLASMGTTALAVLVGFLIIPGVFLLVKLCRQGFSEVRQHWRENIRDGVITTAIVWLALFSYHLFYKVPHDIRMQAERAKPTAPVPPTTINPPPEAYAKTKTRTKQPDFIKPLPPMFGQASDKFNISLGSMSSTFTADSVPACLANFYRTCLVKPFIENHRFVVDAVLYSAPGRGEVTLVRNVLHKNIPEWDVCMSATTLEVVDENLTPVFQMLYLGANDIVINGMFHVGGMLYMASRDQNSFHPDNEPTTASEYPVKRIFEYPSQK
jgi:hypothetical protein